MIELKNISKYYSVDEKKIIAIDNVSLFVPRGVIFGIIGESGAGKSSLLRCVNLLERPNQGSVSVAGHELSSLPPAALRVQRRRIGMIFQHFNLLGSQTVFENIALPLKLSHMKSSEINNIIVPLLSLVGLLGKEKNYPHQLSGGQKQRVAIARALATKPDVLLCDEATSALDPKTTESILNLLQEINQKTGLTILLITHELDVIKSICNRVALMHQGQIIENDDIINFFAKPKSSIAKSIVYNALKMHIPPKLNELLSHSSSLKPYPVVRIIFKGALVHEAIISMASRHYLIDINIMQSNIEFIGTSPMGFLLVELRGTPLAIKQTLSFFAEKNLECEVIGYVS
jgi:D-methionine transport system ATP-binding protein